MTNKIVALTVSAALLASAAPAAASAPEPQTGGQGGWLMLSMLSSSSAAGDAGAAAQPQTDAPPPQSLPVAPNSATNGGIPTPPIPVIAIWLAEIGVAIWIATRHHHHVVFPNSPA